MNRFFSFYKQYKPIKRNSIITPSNQLIKRTIIKRPANTFQRNLIERLKNPASCACGK